jgi:hypothetical protein
LGIGVLLPLLIFLEGEELLPVVLVNVDMPNTVVVSPHIHMEGVLLPG